MSKARELRVHIPHHVRMQDVTGNEDDESSASFIKTAAKPPATPKAPAALEPYGTGAAGKPYAYKKDLRRLHGWRTARELAEAARLDQEQKRERQLAEAGGERQFFLFRPLRELGAFIASRWRRLLP